MHRPQQDTFQKALLRNTMAFGAGALGLGFGSLVGASVGGLVAFYKARDYWRHAQRQPGLSDEEAQLSPNERRLMRELGRLRSQVSAMRSIHMVSAAMSMYADQIETESAERLRRLKQKMKVMHPNSAWFWEDDEEDEEPGAEDDGGSTGSGGLH